MSRSARFAFAGAVLAAALAAPSPCPAQEVIAYAEERPVLDYDAFLSSVPEMKETMKGTMELVKELAECMDRLSAAEKDAGRNREERTMARDLLLRYRDAKVRLVRLADRCLKTPAAAESDLAILQRLRETELVGVSWPENSRYIDCLRDLARELKLRIVMHPDVLKFNTVEAAFPKTSADSLLRQLTAGFDCEYIVYNGEVVVIKAIKRNDARMQKYLDKHPDWKYWRPKDAPEIEDDLMALPGLPAAPASFSEVLRRAVLAAAVEEPAKARIEDMDMGLLQRNLLKIYVSEKESAINETRLEELRLAVETGTAPGHHQKADQTAEELKAVEEERHKHIFHYLLLEKTCSVQVIHVVDRVLGAEVRLAGEGKAERAILDRPIDAIEIPRAANGKGTEIHEAAKIVSKALGVPVTVRSVDTKIYRITLSLERTTGEVVLKHICSSLPFDYYFEEGGIVLRHRQLRGKDPALKEIEEEEKKAKEEEGL